MKTFYFFPAIAIAAVCFMVSCTQSDKYDNTITDYILKADGQQKKFSVKIHNIKDQGRIIILDTNKKLTEQAKERKAQLTKLEEQLVALQDELFKLEVDGNASGRETMETYITKISNLQQQIEYLKTEGATADSLDVKSGEEISAIIVKCKYSMIYLGEEKEVIMTKSFVISEDGKTCYGLVDDFVEAPK